MSGYDPFSEISEKGFCFLEKFVIYYFYMF